MSERSELRYAWRDMILSAAGPSDPGARLTALGVDACVNGRTLSTFASVGTIAEKTAQKDRTVRTHLQSLVDEGWLVVDERRNGRTKLYRLNIPEQTPAIFAGVNAGSPRQILQSTPAEFAGDPGKKQHEPRQNLPTIPSVSPSLTPVLSPASQIRKSEHVDREEQMRKARKHLQADPTADVHRLYGVSPIELQTSAQDSAA